MSEIFSNDVVKYDPSVINYYNKYGLTSTEHRQAMMYLSMVALQDERGSLLGRVEELEDRVDYDDLTGLLRRDAFKSRLQQMVDNLENRHLFNNRRNDNPISIAILVLDMDGLKITNDTFGHAIGDDLIVSFSEVLTSTVRPDDLVCRIGGDEFIVALDQGIDELGLEAVCDRIVEATKNISIGNYDIDPGVSIGGCMYEKGYASSELINLADSRLYVAKRKVGKNNIELGMNGEDEIDLRQISL